MFVGGLFNLLLLGAIGYGIYRLLTARTNDRTAVAGESDVREQVARFFRLGLLFGAVVLSAEGVAGLIGEALSRSDELAEDSTALAQALSFTIVGLPALFGLARWTKHRLAIDPDDVTSPVWAAYLGGTVSVALIVTIVSGHRTLEWMVGLYDFDSRALGRTITWSAVLAVHWQLNRRRPLLDRYGAPEARTPWYLLVGSLIGLVTAVTGVWQLIRNSLRSVYDGLFSEVMASDETGLLLGALVSAVVGVSVWAWYWLAHTRQAPRTERWYAYVLLIGVLGGLVGTLSSAGVLLHSVLQWFFGDPEAASAAVHFDLVPGTVASGLVGLAVWSHHRQILGTRHGAHRNEADRVYTYLVSFVGLVICAAAITLVVSALIVAAADGDLSTESAANQTVMAATFGLIGFPVWLVFWRRAERNATADLSELRSPSRRVYLMAILGLSAAVALISMVTLLTILLEDLTSGEFSSTTMREIRIPFGLLISSAIVAGYHLLVYRDDRRANPPPPPPTRHVREVILISDLAPEGTSELAKAFGGRVVRFTTTGSGPVPDPDVVTRAIGETESLTTTRALVTVRDGAIEVQELRD